MLLLPDEVKTTQKQYQVGDIITENIPFVSFDNLTREGFLLFHAAMLNAKEKGDENLIKRIKKSVRQSKENTQNTKKYLSNLINAFRERGTVYHDDKITELEVFEWTYMTK